MKVLITGAHFTPAQAVIAELQKFPNIKIVYIGRKNTLEGDKTPSLESQVLPSLGVNFYSIIAGRLRRHFDIQTIISLLKIPVGFIQSFYIMVKEKPDVVLSFGGYIGVPVVIIAWLFSIPIILHEQTLVSGLANRVSGLFASKIAVSYETEYTFAKDKIILTGNALRKELINSSKKSSPQISEFLKRNKALPLLYITGGNQGSHVINQAIGKILHKLLERTLVIHQTGDSKFNDYDNLLALKEKLSKGDRYLLRKWVNIDELVYILKKADLVISRAGANTLLELSFFGIPALLIPIPYLFSDEQNINARFFEKLGLARILPQKELVPERLIDNILYMLSNLGDLKKNASLAKSVVIVDAAKRIAQETLILATNHA